MISCVISRVTWFGAGVNCSVEDSLYIAYPTAYMHYRWMITRFV